MEFGLGVVVTPFPFPQRAGARRVVPKMLDQGWAIREYRFLHPLPCLELWEQDWGGFPSGRPVAHKPNDSTLKMRGGGADRRKLHR